MPALRLWLVMLSDSMSEFFAPDGKLARTFTALFIKPGELSNAYLQGRRVHYINPIRIYIVLSLVFFLALSIQNRFEEPEVTKTEPEERAWIRDIRLPLLTDSQNTAVLQYVDQQIEEAAANPGELMEQIYEISPILLLLLLPLNAVFTKILFWTSRRYFVEHLIVSLHAQSFFYFILILKLFTALLPSVLFFVSTLIDLWIVIYLYLMLKRVYGGRHVTLIPRFFLLVILNGVFTSILFAAAYAIGVLSM